MGRPSPNSVASRRAEAHRRRMQRLARTIAGAAVLVLLIIFGLPRLFGSHGSPTRVATGPTGTRAPSASPSPTVPPPTPLGQPQAITVAALPTGLPAALSREQVQPDGTSLLILGGLMGNNSSATVLRFQPVSDTVAPAGTLAVGTHDAASATFGGHVVVLGGGEAATVDTVQTFVAGGSPPSQVIGHLPTPRSDLGAAAIGGKIYVLGGYDGKTDQAAVLSTTDGVTFRTVTQLPLPVRYAGIAVAGPVIYLIGGEHNGTQTADIQAVDVSTATATVVAHLPAPLSHEAAFVLGGALFVAGGRSGTTSRTQVDSVDLSTGAVARSGVLPQPLADAGVGQLGSDVYLFGGETPNQVTSIIHISPTSG